MKKVVKGFHGLSRSELMSRIRSKGNKKTEVAFLRFLRGARITGWRRHQVLVGHPDFVFRTQRLAVFVDGCFWHNCPIHGHIPVENTSFWSAKLARNMARDKAVTRELRAKGWHVVRIWEHDLRPKDVVKVLKRLKAARIYCPKVA
ncbi:MAG: very short patch repair endonuclease [bacterium]